MKMKQKIMNTTWRYLIAGIVVLSGLSVTPAAQADINCRVSNTWPAVSNSTTLSGSFYAGNDLSNGTLIYQATLISSSSVGIHCDAPFSGIPFLNAIQNEPSGGPTNMSVAGLSGNAYVYPTNVAGVGVVFWAAWDGQHSFSSANPVNNGGYFASTSENQSDNGIGVQIRMGLVKTGNIASGSEVLASSMPTIKAYADATAGYTGLPITLGNWSLQGSIHITSQTCQTPDRTVPMGTYEKSKYFNNVGSTTPWIDASIQLQNCPKFEGFYGNYGDDPLQGQSAIDSGTLSGGSLTANLLKVSLQPATNIIDPANGVLEVNANGSSGSPATGVGIQLGYTPGNINASPTTPTTIWKEGDTWSVTPPNDGTASFRIPLAARYYQVNPVVTPGPANAQVTFVIDYN